MTIYELPDFFVSFLKTCPDGEYGYYSRITITISKKGAIKINTGFQPAGHGSGKGDTLKEAWQSLADNLDALLKILQPLPDYDVTNLAFVIKTIRGAIANTP